MIADTVPNREVFVEHNNTNARRVLIRADHVGVSYRRHLGLLKHDRFWALRDISFNVGAGETLGIIGGNGAGKSTLLRLIAGITTPDRGTIYRRPKTTSSLLALNVGLKPELSGEKNAILGAMLLGLRYQEARRKLPEIREFSGLGEFFDEPVITYSTGMKARLGFSVAMHADPDILLIDEVLGVGDQDFKERSTEAMKAKIRSNKTVILVSHSLESVSELCTRVLWIEKGATIFCGDAQTALHGYKEAIKQAMHEARIAQQNKSSSLTTPA
ncbi:similar to Teichoic acids export ATP-binding protein TagH [gamma proteobacterium HdN1]|nr:similar to Teichoic acids export ATP-binding protein TagH [gamma proteobacterium HdN1]